MHKTQDINDLDDAFEMEESSSVPPDDSHFYYERYKLARQQLAAFQEIAIAVGSQPTLDPILATIVQKTTELMRAERSTIFVLSKSKDYLWSRIAQNSDEIRVQIGEGIAGYVAKTGKSLNIVDVYKCPWFDKKFDEWSGFRTHSCLCQPIWNNQRQIIGVIQVLNKLQGNFTLDDEELLSCICSQIAVTLNNHSMYLSLLSQKFELEEAHQQLLLSSQRLDILYKIQNEVIAASSLEELLKSITSQCLSAFKINICSILVHNETHFEIYISVKHSNSEEFGFHKLIIEKCSAILSSVEQTGDHYIDYATDDHTIDPALFHMHHLNIPLRSILALPLATSETSLGVLLFANKRGYVPGGAPKLFSDSDVKLLSLIASRISSSIAAELHRTAHEKETRLKAIGQMLSSVIHDMKTPLTTIGLSAELMTEIEDKDKRKFVSEKISNQIDTLKRMTSEVLSYARGESNFVARRLNTASLMKSLESLLQPEAQRRSIQLQFKDLYKNMLFCDEAKMQRAIINLVKNAMEALEDGGNIEVLCEKQDNNIVFSVSDDGPGIPETVRSSLFEAFVTSGKRGGTGLGLSIVKNIAQAHHGNIIWTSKEPHGTKFVLSIPL